VRGSHPPGARPTDLENSSRPDPFSPVNVGAFTSWELIESRRWSTRPVNGDSCNPPVTSRFHPAGYYSARRTTDSAAKWGHERAN